mmetsp:Transcript_1261/g.2766  ORF Transcript_1261/g.2766 Transcript_1261/m.2766 type:complete len:333 (-) Transcript_1261:108-1106(-)
MIFTVLRLFAQLSRNLLLSFKSGCTGNNFDKLRGNGGLTSTVVQERELVQHFSGIFGRGFHGLHSRAQLRRVVFEHGVVEQRTHLELGEIKQKFRTIRTFNFVRIKCIHTLFRNLFELVVGQNRRHRRPERNGGLEAVVNQVRLWRVLRHDRIRDAAHRGERQRLLGRIDDNVVDLLRIQARDLRTCLFADDIQRRHAAIHFIQNLRVLHHGGVDTTTQTLIRSNRHDERFPFNLHGRSIPQQPHEWLYQRARLLRARLRALQPRRGDHLHRLCNLLDVPYRLHANLHRLQRNAPRPERRRVTFPRRERRAPDRGRRAHAAPRARPLRHGAA